MSVSRTVARHLLSIGAVSLRPNEPFTWASGLKSPIYCDNRLTMAYPVVRSAIAEGFAALMTEYSLFPDVVVGTATAGIPHAAWLSDRLGLPMAYVRSAPKAHGQGRRVEGLVKPGQRVVVVEDLVSTGDSSVKVVDALREDGVDVLCVLAIFTYGLPHASATFTQAGIPLYTLTDFQTLVNVAAAESLLDPASIEALHDWQRDPAEWSRAREAAS